MSAPSRLTPEQYEPAREMLEGAMRRTRPRIHTVFDVFAAIVYKLEAKIAYRDLPATFPPWRSCHEMYLTWTAKQVGDQCLLEVALEACGRQDAIKELRRLLESTGQFRLTVRGGGSINSKSDVADDDQDAETDDEAPGPR